MNNSHTDMNGEFFVPMLFPSGVTRINIGNAQNKGKRPYQEDSFGFSSLDRDSISEKGFIAVVSDGMGGLSNGDKVSRHTVSSVISMCSRENGELPVHTLFSETANKANENVLKEALGGGATLSAVLCRPDGIYWCSVGDSRIYLFRNGQLCTLSRDLDYMDVLLDRVIDGEIDMETALNDKRKDTLAQYIGMKGKVTPDVNKKPLVPAVGDIIILCSDGVYNALSDKEFIRLLSQGAKQISENIQSEVLKKEYQNQDNFTCVILEFI